jgi:hypothetical protein
MGGEGERRFWGGSLLLPRIAALVFTGRKHHIFIRQLREHNSPSADANTNVNASTDPHPLHSTAMHTNPHPLDSNWSYISTGEHRESGSRSCVYQTSDPHNTYDNTCSMDELYAPQARMLTRMRHGCEYVPGEQFSR